MAYKINALDTLTDCFRALPGIGEKTAQRLAFFVMSMPDEKAEKFADAIIGAKKNIRCCPKCQCFTDKEECPICDNPKREQSMICVVENPSDVIAVERTNEYKGLYHVLHGVLSPTDGIGPNDIKLRELISRLADDNIKEVLIATNPTVEGDVTASYIAKLIKPLGVNVSRLAFGLPVGGDLEYADHVTLSKAIENRRTM